jgi:hypothetical protein
MTFSAMLTKQAFANLGQLFGQEEDHWTSATSDSPGLSTKMQPGEDVTYVKQTPGKSPLEAAQGQQDPTLQMFLLHHLLGGSGQSPAITIGGHQQDPMNQLMMMSLLGQGMGKKAATMSKDLASLVGRHSGDYGKRIVKQLTPEHFQAAGGSGGEDTIEELVSSVIPREIIARHAMQLGSGDVNLGKAILDMHLKQNPMHTGENLESVMRRLLKANIAETQDANVQKAMKGLGDFGSPVSSPRLSREDLMKIIQDVGSQGADQVGPKARGLAPALPEPGLSPAIGYPKTGRFENMKPVFDDMVKEAIPLFSKAIEHLRGGPAVSTQEISQKMPLSRLVTESGKPAPVDPDVFHNVFMRSPSVQRMARGLSPEVIEQMGRALKPGLSGMFSRGLQRHLMGRGSHVDAAQEALKNMAAATGATGSADPRALAQHFQTITGTPKKRVGDYLARQLSGAAAPQTGGQATNLFGIPGLGMEIDNPLQKIIQQMMMIKAMTSQPQTPRTGAA